MAGKNDGKIRCSFCGKTQEQVARLISGPNGAFICDECIDICAEILEEEAVENGGGKAEAKNNTKQNCYRLFSHSHLTAHQQFYEVHRVLQDRQYLPLSA